MSTQRYLFIRRGTNGQVRSMTVLNSPDSERRCRRSRFAGGLGEIFFGIKAEVTAAGAAGLVPTPN